MCVAAVAAAPFDLKIREAEREEEEMGRARERERERESGNEKGWNGIPVSKWNSRGTLRARVYMREKTRSKSNLMSTRVQLNGDEGIYVYVQLEISPGLAVGCLYIRVERIFSCLFSALITYFNMCWRPWPRCQYILRGGWRDGCGFGPLVSADMVFCKRYRVGCVVLGIDDTVF